jgi:hypothetical protein
MASSRLNVADTGVARVVPHDEVGCASRARSESLAAMTIANWTTPLCCRLTAEALST